MKAALLLGQDYVWLMLVAWALLMVAEGAAQIRAHPAYEPPDPTPLEGSPNLFLRASVTASPHWSDRAPEFAVNGRRDNAGEHWAAENIPVWLTLDLGEPRELNTIRLWTYWDNRRYYQYVIEGSEDGETWVVLVDRRENATAATALGETFHFPTATVRYVRTTFTHNSASNVAGGHIVEIEGYAIAPEQARAMMEREEAWRGVTPGLHGAVGSTDRRYARALVPDLAETEGGRRWSAVAWRGERASGQVVLWTGEGARQVRLAASALRSQAGDELPRDCLQVRFVRYVLGDGQVLGDVLDTAERLDLAPHSARPVWVSVEPPADARPGVYSGRIEARGEGLEPLVFEVEVEVLPAVLPPAAEWAFRLDLWQNPYAVARYHHVEPWSPEHVAVLEPHLRLLAGAGQKCITTTIVYQPWGTQTYDPYDSMVEWTRRADGTWSFDYTHFDQYVELANRCGITDSISCYSMVPWTNRFRYLDEATGDYSYVQAAPGTEEYAALWRAFLGDFVGHLRERGWLERAAIAMDERPAELMKPMLALLRESAPELKVALAGGNEAELKDAVDDWCVFISPALDPAIARERAERGLPTTFYVCCGPGRPNTFTFSPPAEAAWMGLYAAAKGYSGFLRWAFDSWVEDPLWDTSYVSWPAGDCFLTYPGPRSSVRFERLREGIQDCEKVRMLREALAGRHDEAVREGLRRLDEALAGFTFEQVQKEPAAEAVNRVRGVLVELSRLAAGGWRG